MIPTIEKLKLSQLSLSSKAKKEVISILKNKQNIKGFKFRSVGKNCVMVGKSTGNDFDLLAAAANAQQLMKNRKRAVPDKFRFVFLGAPTLTDAV